MEAINLDHNFKKMNVNQTHTHIRIRIKIEIGGWYGNG